jgi:glucose/arabinose dehydrogenase
MNRLPILFLALLPFIGACKNKALKKVENPKLAEIKLPPGFEISLFAADVDNARSMALGDKGTVFVGNRASDNVYALVDMDGDGQAETKYTLISGMKTPNGIAFHDGSLFVAQVDKIWRLDNIEANLAAPPKPVLVYDSLPDKAHHGWKYIAFGPDGKLYLQIGAPCNICNDAEKDPRFATIDRMNADGTGFEIFAHGIRNSVGFDWHPQTKELWFTENGRDELGDDTPPDELNVAPRAGMHFGYPFCHAGEIPDPEFGKLRPCADFSAPVAKLAPHTAALGMRFYTGSMFPQEYKNTIFIAEHGSWNRSKPIGYRITTVSFDAAGTPTYKPFAEGWLSGDKSWGRPVDVLQMKDGSLLVSDDFANCIYRISYKK